MKYSHSTKRSSKSFALTLITQVFLILLVSCCESESSYDFINTKKGKEYYALSDSVYFGWIKDMKFFNNELLLADAGQNKIHRTSENLDYIGSFGQTGSGPQELRGVLSVAIDLKDSIIGVYDFSRKKSVLFNKSFESYSEVNKILNGLGQIAISESRLYSKSNNPDYLFYQTNLIEKNHTLFGIPFDNSLNEPDLSFFIYAEELYVLTTQNDLLLRKYDSQMQLAWEKNLFNHEFLIKWKQSLNIDQLINSSDANVKRAQILAMDSELINNKLYILLPQIIIKDKNYPNLLLEIELLQDNKNMKIYKVQESDEDNFSSFTIVENTFYGYSPGSGAIYTRAINE